MSMATIITALATACFAFACGIFLTLSYIEKAVWCLMRDPLSACVDDGEARLVHAQLKRVIRLLPPTMKTTMASGTLLLMLQAWQLDFAWPALIVLVFLLLGLGYLLSQLSGRIAAVERSDSEGDIEVVRRTLGQLAALHHFGLFLAVGVVVLQVVVLAMKG
ncbi:MAG: hypothetical protein ACQETX_00455 [Pseudomonadota bacterium]